MPTVNRLGALLLLAGLVLAGPVQASQGIDWAASYDVALEKAQSEDKPIVVDFWATWCGWCRVQDREVFSKDEMIEFSRDHVYVKLNTEDGAEGTKLAQKLGVASLPTIVVMGSDGRELDRIAGYLPLKEFIEELRKILQGKSYFQQLAGKEDPGARELLQLASFYLERGDVDGAMEAFVRLLAEDPNNESGYADDALYFLGQLSFADGEMEAAERHFHAYLDRYPDGDNAPGVRRLLEIIRSSSGGDGPADRG